MRSPRPKNAASLVLVRRDGGTPRVLMGHRHSGHVFMPNLWVFPGGRLERKDYRAKTASDLSAEASHALAASVRPSLARALAICAVREVGEETGVFLGRDGLPHLAPLRLAARAITPPGHPRRFDTHFFTADASHLENPEPGPGDGEFDAIDWISVDAVDLLSPHPVTRRVLDSVLALI